MNAATILVKIPYVIWRNGRPRFSPGAALRRLGFKGRDLKRDDGQWMTLADCQTFVLDLQADIARRRTMKPAQLRKAAAKRPDYYAMSQLFADLFQQAKFRPQAETRVKVLAPSTVRNYRQMANSLQDFDEELWSSPVAAVSPKVAWGLYQKLYEAKGLHMARHIVATCRMAWSWARKTGRASQNPFKDLGMEMPQGRVRVAQPAAIKALVAQADAEGLHDVGDMILFAVFTTQRQGDRFKAMADDLADGRFRVRQSKTRKEIGASLPAVLLARFAAAGERRKGHKVQWPQLVINERLQRPWQASHYRHVFRALCDRVAAGGWPQLEGFTDQDLRDTAISWARRGGADFETRRKLSGHSQKSAEVEERHYLERMESDGTDAAAVIAKVWEAE